MNALQERCRPKHQVLVLKCYPRTTKGAVDVKPNSSELSYLLYYATSRRTKIQKVGSFLEKKTASDVWRQRIGCVPPIWSPVASAPARRRRGREASSPRVVGLPGGRYVQVTLQILEALIEKNPKDLPLFASSVLRILDLVLRSNDITMVESSLPTFEAFCANHDASSLVADQANLKQYEAVVHQYAQLASTRGSPGKTQPSAPVAMRWRTAGLGAIKNMASTDALSVSGRQYDMVVPMILENLWTDNEDFLEVLLQRADMEEKVDTDRLLKRRTSIATVRTADTAGDTNPIALSGTAMDVDKLAEEEVGVLAMQCFKQIFAAPNRSQIRAATVALLRFIEERINQNETVVKTIPKTEKDCGWAIKMFGLVSRWAPVHERYVILVTAVDIMGKMRLADETLPQHIALVAMIASLLRSEVNLIGLSVMDVLLSLIQHMKRLVQLPGDPSHTPGAGILPGQPDPRSPTTKAAADADALTASRRKELLNRLQHCIGDLATHVYYADQISDMISAILHRLKPARSSSTANSSPPGEKADDPIPSVANSVEGLSIDSLFSLTVAKTAALRAIKSILLVANPRTKLSGNVNLSRNRVPMQVWEGTHWLLRDPDGQVRKAYADALLTWLDRETTRADLTARDETAAKYRSSKNGREMPSTSSAMRRAVSSASNRDKPTKVPRCHFLQLIHLAIYDNALQHVDYETDIVLLHVLLVKLVNQLGVNAVRHGLPMIFQLQESIQEAETPLAKVRIGSLVHGYFWLLTEKFDFDASVVGRAIHNEIIRRRSKHFWVEGVHVPAPLLELVGTPGLSRPQPKMPTREIEMEALLPFDDRVSMVECICTAYGEGALLSPPQSPGTSPGRTPAHPMLSSTLSSMPAAETEREIPSHFREQMLTDWSREAVLLAVQAGSKSASLTGSKTGTSGTHRHRLAVLNGGGANGLSGGGGISPNASQHNLRPASQPVGLGLRKSSVRSALSPSPVSSSGRVGFVTSVDQLKMVLTGQAQAAAQLGPLGPPPRDDSSDSMASYEMTPSELSFSTPPPQRPEHAVENAPGPALKRSMSIERKGSFGPLNSHPSHEPTTLVDEAGEDDEDVPPVPPIPSPLVHQAAFPLALSFQDNNHAGPSHHTPTTAHAPRPTSSRRRNVVSRGGDSILSSALGDDAPTMDLQTLLSGIDGRAGESRLGGHVTRPPY